MPTKSKKPPVNINLLPPVPAYKLPETDVEHDARPLLSTPLPLGYIPIILRTRYTGDT